MTCERACDCGEFFCSAVAGDLTPAYSRGIERRAMMDRWEREDTETEGGWDDPPPGGRECKTFTCQGDTLSFGAPGFTTVRACIDCGVLIAGGPTRCLACGVQWRGNEPEAQTEVLPPLTETQEAIVDECDAMSNLLLAKNRAYGNSATDPIRIFSRADSQEQLRVRIDDKLSRLKRGVGDEEDTVTDLIGYLILYKVQRRLAKGVE